MKKKKRFGSFFLFFVSNWMLMAIISEMLALLKPGSGLGLELQQAESVLANSLNLVKQLCAIPYPVFTQTNML